MKKIVTVLFIFIATSAFPQKIDDVFKTMPNSSYRDYRTAQDMLLVDTGKLSSPTPGEK